MHQAHSTIVLGDKDNVAIALKAILKDDSIGELGLNARTDIPKGHKVARRAIPSGEAVFKYGQIIGCLLYTSPSPRDRGCSRMPSSA